MSCAVPYFRSLIVGNCCGHILTLQEFRVVVFAESLYGTLGSVDVFLAIGFRPEVMARLDSASTPTVYELMIQHLVE